MLFIPWFIEKRISWALMGFRLGLLLQAARGYGLHQVLLISPNMHRRPAEGGNKAAKLKAIREALRTAKRVWLATDCDREGQLIGQEILEHYEYRGQVMRVLFTAQYSQTMRDAFGRAKPNTEYSRLYAAAVARRQADQIYNLSLTRTATVILGKGARRVIGVGRVKTPTATASASPQVLVAQQFPMV